MIGITVQSSSNLEQISKVGIVALGATVLFGVLYTTTLMWAINKEEPDYIKFDSDLLRSTDYLINLTFWSFVSGTVALIVSVIR